MQPLMETVLSYPRQYATALSNRLWKRYATAYGNGVSSPKIPRTAAQATQSLSCLIKFFRQQHNEPRRAYSNIPLYNLKPQKLRQHTTIS